MMNDTDETTYKQLQWEVFAANRAAMDADNAWQAALDKAKVDRWSKASTQEPFKELHAAKLCADQRMRDANDALRACKRED